MYIYKLLMIDQGWHMTGAWVFNGPQPQDFLLPLVLARVHGTLSTCNTHVYWRNVTFYIVGMQSYTFGLSLIPLKITSTDFFSEINHYWHVSHLCQLSSLYPESGSLLDTDWISRSPTIMIILIIPWGVREATFPLGPPIRPKNTYKCP